MFDSYNKTWGSLAAVIVMLTWLWVTAIALLLGAEINSEAERSRELRQGQPRRAHDPGARPGPSAAPGYTGFLGPRSSADRAADFESACGGSTPPGAMLSID